MPVFLAGLLRAASLEERVETLFRPPLGEVMALAPDGARIAYTDPANGQLTIVMMEVETPGKRRTVKIEPERDAASADTRAPAPLRFMRWATPTRLVFALEERIVPLPPITLPDGRTAPNPDGPTIVAPIMAVDADGGERGTLVDASDFQETPASARKSLADLLRTTQELAAERNDPVHWRMPHLDILGFLPRDREQLIVGTHGAYSVPMQHLVDIRNGRRREFGDTWSVPPGEPQVFDWFQLKVVGERRAGARPTTVWRDAGLEKIQQELAAKFPRRCVELLDWSDNRARVLCRVTGGTDPGRIFVYQRPEDLVVEILRRAPWLDAAKLHETRFFEGEASDGTPFSGFLTWPRHAGAAPPPLLVIFSAETSGRALPAFDPEAQIFADAGFAVVRLNPRAIVGTPPDERAAIADAGAALDWLAAHRPARPFDRARVAALGRGAGGYLAERALEIQPALFRCSVAIDPPSSNHDRAAARLELASGPDAASPAARAALYQKIREFLGQQLPGRDAKSGAGKVME